jgi:serine/threonine-protein kinase ULK/ATG1
LLHPPTEEEYAQGHPYGIPVLKVADFGFARILPAATMAETLCGSPLYMAPEILRYEKYDAKVDLWSIGAVLFEMAVGKPPFRAQNHVELLRRIEKGEDRIKFPDERQPSELKQGETVGVPVDGDIKDLIRRLLKKNPENRMPFEDLFTSRVWDGYLSTATATRTMAREEVVAVPLARRDSRSRRRSTDLAPSQDRRRPSEPRYYVSSDVSPPVQTQEQLVPSRARQSSGGNLARPIDISPPAAPQPARAQPVAVGSPLADQGAAMVRRPSTSSARRYSTLGRGNSFRQPERTTPDSVSPASQEVPVAPASDRPVSRGSIDRSSDAGRPASAQANMQESEYVVVEKKTVEVNALADGEFPNAPDQRQLKI